MKIPVALFGLTFATSLALAQPAPAPIPANPPAPAAPATPAAKATAAKPGPAKPDDKKGEKKTDKKVEVMGKIPGTTIPRANGTFLGLEVVNGNFKLTFYDKKKKPTNLDVTRATARWPNPRAPGDNRTVLNGSGTSLVGSKPVVPPYNFNVYLTLLQGEGDDAKAVENYVVQFRG